MCSRRLAEGEGQALILRDGLLELTLGLEQLLFEGADPLRRVLHAATQTEHFFFEHLRLVAELCYLSHVGGISTLRIGLAHCRYLAR